MCRNSCLRLCFVLPDDNNYRLIRHQWHNMCNTTIDILITTIAQPYHGRESSFHAAAMHFSCKIPEQSLPIEDSPLEQRHPMLQPNGKVENFVILSLGAKNLKLSAAARILLYRAVIERIFLSLCYLE